MFTLKLKRRADQYIRIIECPDEVVVSTEGSRRVVSTGNKIFHVGRSEEFDEAYVENFHGTTTHIIRAP